MEASLTTSPRSTSAGSLTGASFDIGPTAGNSKRKRRPAGTPDPDAEVVALSPKTLMESDRYVCEICSQGFQRDQNLQMHRRKHKVPWKLLKRPSSEVRKRVYVCPDPSCLHHDPCHALGDLVGIKKHYRRKHSCEKQWKCEKCSKCYAVQSDYKAHLKTCGTRGHCCDCGRVFSRVESFIEHQDTCNAARDKTAVASSDQTALASFREGNGSASPSADTVSVNNRSVDGLVRSLNSTTRYDSTAWFKDHQELQLLPAKRYIDSTPSSSPVYSFDRSRKKNFFIKEPESYAAQSRLTECSPTFARPNAIAVVNEKDVSPPHLQLSIGLYYESLHGTLCAEQKGGLNKNNAALERLSSWSDMNPPSLASDASVTEGSGRSSTNTKNEVGNGRLIFSHVKSTHHETPELKAHLSRNVENSTALELATNKVASCGLEEKNTVSVEGSEGVEDKHKLTWTSTKDARPQGKRPIRSEEVAAMLEDMGSDSRKELSRSQAEVSTSGSAAQTVSTLKGESGRWRDEDEYEHMKRRAREQLRLAVAYVEEARQSAKAQIEMAEADLSNAIRIREYAQTQLLQAYLFQRQATRRIDSSRLQITCQACRQNFHLQIALPTTEVAFPLNLENSSSMDVT